MIAGVTTRQIPGQVVRLRKAEGLTQKEPAERAEMTPDGVVRLASGQRRLT